MSALCVNSYDDSIHGPGSWSLLPLRKVLRVVEDKDVGEGQVRLDGWVLDWILAGKARGSVIVNEYSQ